MWWYRQGEWIEVSISSITGSEISVVRFGYDEGSTYTACLHTLRVDMPTDCGKLVVCRGTAGSRWWMEHDPSVFDPLWEGGL